MNYEQKYKESLKRARDMMYYKEVRREDMEYLFPELKESEDERIRKELLSFCQNRAYYFPHDPKYVNINNWIAWLEKQGKETSWKPSKDLYGIEDDVRRRSTIQVLEYARSLDTYNQYGKADIDKNIAWLEQTDIANKEYWQGYREGKQEILDKYAELEKQRDQKHVDKVEPKFKIGDWIITPKNKVLQITNIEDTSYVFNNESRYWEIYYCDKQCRLWTIEDAKDGDVLCLGCVIAIFKKYIGQNKCICYCSFCDNGGFEIPIENGEDNVYGCTDTTPATQEKRDLLFTKMKEAGYEWDADKKELIKL